MVNEVTKKQDVETEVKKIPPRDRAGVVDALNFAAANPAGSAAHMAGEPFQHPRAFAVSHARLLCYRPYGRPSTLLGRK